MNIDDLTIAQAKQLATMFFPQTQMRATHSPRKVIVCTEKRGVVFGTTVDVNSDPIELTDARMCLRWSAQIGGVFGLSEKGPFDALRSGDTTISAICPSILLKEVTAVFEVSPEAIKAWESAPVAGR